VKKNVIFYFSFTVKKQPQSLTAQTESTFPFPHLLAGIYIATKYLQNFAMTHTIIADEELVGASTFVHISTIVGFETCGVPGHAAGPFQHSDSLLPVYHVLSWRRSDSKTWRVVVIASHSPTVSVMVDMPERKSSRASTLIFVTHK